MLIVLYSGENDKKKYWTGRHNSVIIKNNMKRGSGVP